MAKRIGEVDGSTGKVRTGAPRGQGRTTEIPWTRGPQTRWQKFKRAAVG
jgi:hypothetical protein